MLWSILIPILAQVALSFFLPKLKPWLDKLLDALKASEAARAILAKAKPADVAGFRTIYPDMLDAAVADIERTHPLTRAERRQLKRARTLLLRNKVVAASWNQMVATGKVKSVKAARDVSYDDLVATAFTPIED